MSYICPKQEFIEWRDQPITQDLFGILVEIANTSVAEVINRSTSELQRDQFLKGMTSAISQVLAYRPDFIEDLKQETPSSDPLEGLYKVDNDEA